MRIAFLVLTLSVLGAGCAGPADETSPGDAGSHDSPGSLETADEASQLRLNSPDQTQTETTAVDRGPTLQGPRLTDPNPAP